MNGNTVNQFNSVDGRRVYKILAECAKVKDQNVTNLGQMAELLTERSHINGTINESLARVNIHGDSVVVKVTIETGERVDAMGTVVIQRPREGKKKPKRWLFW